MGVGVLFDLVILVVTPAVSIWYPSSMICTFYIPHFIRIRGCSGKKCKHIHNFVMNVDQAIKIRPINKCVYVHCACVISQSSNDGKQFKEDLSRPNQLNMAEKFVENFIFLRCIGERNDFQNLKLSFIY